MTRRTWASENVTSPDEVPDHTNNLKLLVWRGTEGICQGSAVKHLLSWSWALLCYCSSTLTSLTEPEQQQSNSPGLQGVCSHVCRPD